MDYAQLLAIALNDIHNADFSALRQAYTHTPHYDPYRSGEPDATLVALIEAGSWSAAAVHCEQLLAADYLHAPLHLIMAYIYQQLEDGTRAEWHLRFARGLISALLKSGDGRSPETAFQVITVREEYELLRAFNLQALQQRLIVHNNQYYDVLTVRDINGDEGEIFFEVSAIIRRTSQ